MLRNRCEGFGYVVLGMLKKKGRDSSNIETFRELVLERLNLDVRRGIRGGILKGI